MGKLIDYRLAGMVFAVAGALSTQACGEDGPGIPGSDTLLKECGLTCSAEGIAEGNASISGVASVDAFFGAVVNFDAKAKLVTGNINAELAKIRALLELDADAGAAEIKAAMIAKFNLDADAGVSIKYQPAQCAISAQATIEATAKCDASFDPGSATVECSGTCEAEAGVQAECSGEATLKCTGTAPGLACEGECKGGCELEVAAVCEGTCKGTCSGTCSAENADGSCAGSCDGMCEGTCEASAGASCSGKCKGECTYTAPEGGCEGGATAKCEASANAKVECSGKCEGEITPPSASAECEASAKAEASVNVECTPPSLDIAYQFDASLDAEARLDAQANFEAFLVTFRGSFSAILAQLARADVVLEAGAGIATAASGAVTGAVNASLDGDLSLKAAIGLGCALTELKVVPGVIGDATADLQASVSAAGQLTTAFGS